MDELRMRQDLAKLESRLVQIEATARVERKWIMIVGRNPCWHTRLYKDDLAAGGGGKSTGRVESEQNLRSARRRWLMRKQEDGLKRM